MKTAVQIVQEIKKHKPIDKTNVMYDETWEDYLRGNIKNKGKRAGKPIEGNNDSYNCVNWIP